MRVLPYRPLGSFRLLLALLVVAQHYLQWCFPGALQQIVMPFEPGTTAVYVFFALSGFVITEAADCIYRGRPVAFSLNRVLRIVPLYLVSVALCFLVLAIARLDSDAFSVRNIVANVLAIVPLPGRFSVQPQFAVLRISWALRVEAVFYIVTALLLVASIFADFRRAALSLGAVLLIMSVAVADRPYLDFAPFFVCGAAFYLALGGNKTAVVTTVCAAFLSIGAAGGLWPLYSVLLIAAGLLASRALPRHKLDRALGELSYPVYLCHWIPLVPFDHRAPPTHPWLILGIGLFLPVLFWISFEPLVGRVRSTVRGMTIERLSQARPAP